MHPDDIVARSRATDEFKDAVHILDAGRLTPPVESMRKAPPVKLHRIVTYLLFAEPELEVTNVRITGASGCSDFSGTIEVATPAATRIFDFVWDCRWRAEQEGWVDYFGQPDQIRAAREFGWQCMASWRERIAVPASR